MKKINALLLSASFVFVSFLSAQENPGIAAYSTNHTLTDNLPQVIMPAHDFSEDLAAAETFEKMGNYPRFARAFDLNLTLLNAGTWTNLPNGDRVWRLALKSNGALATSLFFDNFYIPEGATMHVYSPDRKQMLGSFTYLDNQGNQLFSTEFINGEESVIEYFEPVAVKEQGSLRITSLGHKYRGLSMADDCQVNVICTPEGDNWQDEKRGVVRIQVKEGSQIGYCSGSLINNTAMDCKRYILTAFHCGVNCTTSDFNGWKFYFNYEATQCTGQSDNFGTVNNVFTGCTKRADSNDNGGDSGSDFLLVQMNATTKPTWWSNVYFNGWSKATTAPVSGSICIHHPSGSNKKISKTTGTASSSSWGGQVAGTHWRVHWTGTTNGWGVTEGGSSGSPLFNASGQIVGTLTGGSSYCNSVQPNGQNQPDSYGKMSYHWATNGTTNARQLKPWLDPTNSGVSSLNGMNNQCTGVGVDELTGNQSSLSVYPNPNNGLFTVAVKLEHASISEITVFSYIGQKVYHLKTGNFANGTYQLDLTNQPEGIYFVHLNTGSKTEVKTIVITSK
ncbi:MAG: T9SS type A sorting domain-containing protein [Bacteroidia bacterium]